MRPSMTRTPQVNQGKRMASGAMRTRLSRDNSNAVKKTSNSMTWGITDHFGHQPGPYIAWLWRRHGG